MDDIKRFIRDHERLMNVLSAIYRFFGMNRIKGGRNLKLTWRGVFAHHIRIANHGTGNVIEIGKGCRD